MLKLSDERLLRAQAYIDGAWVAARSGEPFAVTNPATGEALAKLADRAGIPAGVFNVAPSSRTAEVGRTAVMPAPLHLRKSTLRKGPHVLPVLRCQTTDPREEAQGGRSSLSGTVDGELGEGAESGSRKDWQSSEWSRPMQDEPNALFGLTGRAKALVLLLAALSLMLLVGRDLDARRHGVRAYAEAQAIAEGQAPRQAANAGDQIEEKLKADEMAAGATWAKLHNARSSADCPASSDVFFAGCVAAMHSSLR